MTGERKYLSDYHIVLKAYSISSSVFCCSNSNPQVLDSNSLKHFIKTDTVQEKMKKVIRIPQRRIRIPFLENLDWKRWFESLKGVFEYRFQNVQAEESEDSDSNPYWEDLNLDSSKVFSNKWIWISIQAIQILGEERSETEGHRFESLNYEFESLMKNKWRDWSWIRITYTMIRILGFGVMKNKSKWFKSSSYGFESHIQKWSWRLKVRQKDSNFQVIDSNPSLAQNSNFTKAIRIRTQRFESPFLQKH